MSSSNNNLYGFQKKIYANKKNSEKITFNSKNNRNISTSIGDMFNQFELIEKLGEGSFS